MENETTKNTKKRLNKMPRNHKTAQKKLRQIKHSTAHRVCDRLRG